MTSASSFLLLLISAISSSTFSAAQLKIDRGDVTVISGEIPWLSLNRSGAQLHGLQSADDKSAVLLYFKSEYTDYDGIVLIGELLDFATISIPFGAEQVQRLANSSYCFLIISLPHEHLPSTCFIRFSALMYREHQAISDAHSLNESHLIAYSQPFCDIVIRNPSHQCTENSEINCPLPRSLEAILIPKNDTEEQISTVAATDNYTIKTDDRPIGISRSSNSNIKSTAWQLLVPLLLLVFALAAIVTICLPILYKAKSCQRTELDKITILVPIGDPDFNLAEYFKCPDQDLIDMVQRMEQYRLENVAQFYFKI